ncbi:hypothetical protein HBH98_146130 [Parastagonospora nodorum]|nr:hypothetical protein HBH52_223890 [Parastagonospora nodorum]KAH3964949.1 hypothetical protein HBH51_154890 [Parastagonospora nodorum]KAH3995351.1 hypothetical protein HBI10_172950 [Parastagonospora nodorum]KAH4047037.1 hypothetical protein HBH49_176660 [Parastagonospora nodorum]KAH4100888.1 hypothetical protein HBH46_146930 [Parastagonospora nodorum]
MTEQSSAHASIEWFSFLKKQLNKTLNPILSFSIKGSKHRSVSALFEIHCHKKRVIEKKTIASSLIMPEHIRR